MLNFTDTQFVKSVYTISELPEEEFPEIAFAGRSNVGKSSLINKMINRKNLVKVSSQPGKTRCLNFFQEKQDLYLVDLPGYGYAKVSRQMKSDWKGLITSYLLNRTVLRCVVVIVDIRHALKAQDLELVTWLRSERIPFLLVYTKVDKLSQSKKAMQASSLDAGFGISKGDRVLFSAKSGEGNENLISRLDHFVG
ncbi:MAG: YihA family ribosome biogenesis GTP-binding protein [Desulfobulbaceae bacterium]|uniref:Probable GTP-binding protein EngB n=1 Tax=Candidatus Desulfobia pelagia TaxID=2841692 RepID=A0A8J6NDL1_9BACT|nr:YihA family ribosome biogenesis GTP-binding protein [Candidatus Desulfobia pelagia]